MCRAVWWWARAAEAGCPWFRVADGGSSARSLALVVWVCPGFCTRLREVLVSFWCKSESVLKSEFGGRGESLLPGPRNVKLFPCKAANFGNALHLMYHEGCEESQEKKKKKANSLRQTSINLQFAHICMKEKMRIGCRSGNDFCRIFHRSESAGASCGPRRAAGSTCSQHTSPGCAWFVHRQLCVCARGALP